MSADTHDKEFAPASSGPLAGGASQHGPGSTRRRHNHTLALPLTSVHTLTSPSLKQAVYPAYNESFFDQVVLAFCTTAASIAFLALRDEASPAASERAEATARCCV